MIKKFCKITIAAMLCTVLLLCQNAVSVFAEDAMTRLEAVIFIEKSSGCPVDESYAEYNPFSDVPEEAEGYVGYAYKLGFVKGVSEDFFDCNRVVTRAEFLTMVLRRLGYKSDLSFSWDNPFERAYLSGIYDYEEDLGCDFTKDEACEIMAKAFFAHMPASGVESLYKNNVVPGEKIAEKVEFEAQNRSAYREALSKVSVNTGWLCYKKELPDYMIIFGYLLGTPHRDQGRGYVIRKNDGEVTSLPLPSTNPLTGSKAMPEEIWYNDDETMLYYSAVCTRNFYLPNDPNPYKETYLYIYSVDLETMERIIYSVNMETMEQTIEHYRI